MTFKERFLRGECSVNVIDDWVTAWRQAGLDYKALLPVLGLTEDEYRTWAIAGGDTLAKQIANFANGPHLALHMERDSLEYRLQKLIQSILGENYFISIQREDYYYWNMKFSFPIEMDEETSEKICVALDIQNVDVLQFIWADELQNSQVNSLLSRLVQREVTSNHADDYGVWLICKDSRLPDKEDL